MSDYGAFGYALALAAAGILGVAKWIATQKQKVLFEVAELRESHQDHVAKMREAHAENEGRLIRLEEHEQNTEQRLRELRTLIERVDSKQDGQTELLLTIATRQTHKGDSHGR